MKTLQSQERNVLKGLTGIPGNGVKNVVKKKSGANPIK